MAESVQPLIGTWRLAMPDSTYSARLFAAADGKATLDQVSSTRIAGSPQATQFEQTYLDNLRTVVRFEVDAPDRIRLYYGSARGSGVLVYKRLE